MHAWTPPLPAVNDDSPRARLPGSRVWLKGRHPMRQPVRPISAIHHVRLPVSDVLRSRNWYMEVFGFHAVLDFEEEERVLGVALEQSSSVRVDLHLDPVPAVALRGVPGVAFTVGDRQDLEARVDRLDSLGVKHSLVTEGHLGWFVDASDPDGILVRLHTSAHPASDE